MKYYGSISDPKDLVNKAYVDSKGITVDFETTFTSFSVESPSSITVYFKKAESLTDILDMKYYVKATSSMGYMVNPSRFFPTTSLDAVVVYFANGSSSITGTLHVVAPFEIDRVVSGM